VSRQQATAVADLVAVLRALADGDTEAAAALTVAVGDRGLREILALAVERASATQGELDSVRAALEDRLLTEVFRDAGTGLPNRRALLQRLDHIAVRRRHEPVAVVAVDVLGMKAINDQLGFEAGDSLLLAIAAELQEATGANGVLHRTGGAQFAAVMEGIDSARFATQVSRAALAIPDTALAGVSGIGFACGIAAGPAEENGELFRHASIAASEAPVGEVQVFDAARDVLVQRRRRLEVDIRRAVDLGQLRIVFQPEVELATGELAMAEALVRWDHPLEGPVSPSEFVPLAERTGAINLLGDWVLNSVCNEATALCNTIGGPERIAINLSAAQLRDPFFARRVKAILASSGVDPTLLCFEVTETVVLADGCDVSVLTDLREAGAHVAIDDFGTGYSSLSYLKRLPIDVLKIDQSFVAGLGQDDDDSTIVRAIIHLARRLGYRVVAEGVETAVQAAVLQRFGCDVAQGYAFGAPMDSATLAAWSEERTAGIDLRSPLTAR
jgi:diguanylate cyclase (GGDEF)-like protein